jgi:glycosyltransferase involved in cell wall biosynthesis
MKVLIVNTYDLEGGAAKASYRLHKALIQANIESQMLVLSKSGGDYTVMGKNKRLSKAFTNIRQFFDDIPLKFYHQRSKTHFSSSWVPFSGIIDQINALNPDIVHLNWIGGAMMRISDIGRIKAPIVWSLHDMWAFTGGCHYDEFCGKYTFACNKCKVLGSSRKNDLSKINYQRKKRIFNSIDNLTIIGVSKWLTQCAAKSTLLGTKRTLNIPLPFDTDHFQPIDKTIAREILKLPQDKKIIMFGAMDATSDPRKGFKELSQAINDLDTKEKVELVIFGSEKPENFTPLKYKTHFVGRLHDEVSLQLTYSAADLMVVPSLQENLSMVIMESMACKTPVIAFNIGGNADMIDHQKNGYLAKPFNTNDLGRGIEWVLTHPDYHNLAKEARKKIVEKFNAKMVVQQYINLYQEILNPASASKQKTEKPVPVYTR